MRLGMRAMLMAWVEGSERESWEECGEVEVRATARLARARHVVARMDRAAAPART
jgi:hypothetical protein